MSDAPSDFAAMRGWLISEGYMVPGSQLGVAGFSAAFEEIIDRIIETSTAASTRLHGAPESFHFPPVIGDAEFRQTGYLASFPQLAGILGAYHGDEKSLRPLTSRDGDIDPAEAYGSLEYAQLAMLSVPCHPVYAMLQDTDQPQGRTFTMTGRCFRHEPSKDPMRLQAYRTREYVAVGTEEYVAEYVSRWAEQLPSIFAEIGVDVRAEAANDPFFGRAGKLLASQQRKLDQKTEYLAQVYADSEATAISSLNRPGTHFGEHFTITVNGQTAHTACVGFGLERTAIAWLAQHRYRG